LGKLLRIEKGTTILCRRSSFFSVIIYSSSHSFSMLPYLPKWNKILNVRWLHNRKCMNRKAILWINFRTVSRIILLKKKVVRTVSWNKNEIRILFLTILSMKQCMCLEVRPDVWGFKVWKKLTLIGSCCVVL
jgi:hypothetical protein